MVAYEWITFLTDYGLENKFVGVCRGVMARIAPSVRLLEITHLVPRGDIRHGAAVLDQAILYLPPAVHLAVVDPGVGTERRAIAVSAGGQVLVGPDNGLLCWAADRLGGAESVYQICAPAYFLQPMSTTFHGRDLFSPVAAHIAGGVELSALGPQVPVDSLVRLPLPVRRASDGVVEGEVLIVDRFGNLQTTVDVGLLEQLGVSVGANIEVTANGSVHQCPFVETFGNVSAGELLAHIDSAGLLALAINLGDAGDRTGLIEGSRFRLRRVDHPT